MWTEIVRLNIGKFGKSKILSKTKKILWVFRVYARRDSTQARRPYARWWATNVIIHSLLFLSFPVVGNPYLCHLLWFTYFLGTPAYSSLSWVCSKGIETSTLYIYITQYYAAFYCLINKIFIIFHWIYFQV